jgi:hypothetical protein
MKVLLFTQTGNGRPACISTMRFPPKFYTLGWQPNPRVVKNVDRWWLVEAESAELGRFTIVQAAGGMNGPGKILASGGAHPVNTR